jgi:7,8-dihydroneopterin aldolase/epimerase/oxygenase
MAPTAYRIRLDGIRFRGRHGASDAERYLLQDFVVDLEVGLPVRLLPDSDDRSQVYDYDALASLVVEEGTMKSYKLLESLAARLLDRILEDTPATHATVRIRKFGPPTTASVDTVSVELSTGHQTTDGQPLR